MTRISDAGGGQTLITSTPAGSPVQGTQAQQLEKMQQPDWVGSADVLLSGGTDPTKRGGNLPLLVGQFAPGALPYGVVTVGGASIVTSPEALALNGTDAVSALRRDIVEQHKARGKEVSFKMQRFESATQGGMGVFPTNAVSSFWGNVTRLKGKSLQSVRLVDNKAQGAPPPYAMPASAAEVLALQPGESVAMTQESKLELGGGVFKFDHLPYQMLLDGGFLGSPFYGGFSVKNQGLATTEVVRGEEDAVQMTVSSQSGKGMAASAGLTVGYFLWGGAVARQIAKALMKSGATATEMANAPLWQMEFWGAIVDYTRQNDHKLLADLRFDLSKPAAQQAYEAAARGNLRRVSELAELPDSGIEIPFSLEDTIKSTIIPISLGMFRMGIGWTSSNEEHAISAKIDGVQLRRSKSIKSRSRKLTDYTFRSFEKQFTLSASHTAAVDSKDLPQGVVSQVRELVWQYKVNDRTSSRDELVRDVDFVAGLMGDMAPRELQEYRTRLESVLPHRYGRIGPRNELGRTQVTLTVHLAPDAPEKLLVVAAQADLIGLLADVYTKVGPDGERLPPLWADPRERDKLDGLGATDGVQLKSLTPQALLQRQTYFEARSFVSTIMEMQKLEPSARLAALHGLIGVGRGSRERLGLVVRLLGADAISVDFSVASNRGESGTELSFALKHTGRDVQAPDRLDERT